MGDARRLLLPHRNSRGRPGPARRQHRHRPSPRLPSLAWLANYYEERLRREKLAEAVEASERSVELVRTQYMAGLTNFQNVLDTQRSLFNQLAESEDLLVQNLVSLYKALGGGWSPQDIALPESRLHEVTDKEPPAEG